MASSGTIASPAKDLKGSLGIEIDARFKPVSKGRGREEVLVMGRTQIKSTAVLEAGDLTLKTIKAAVFTPYFGPAMAGGPAVLYGSITRAGSLMNSVTLRVVKGTIIPHTGTQHIGTRLQGTVQTSFFILGA